MKQQLLELVQLSFQQKTEYRGYKVICRMKDKYKHTHYVSSRTSPAPYALLSLSLKFSMDDGLAFSFSIKRQTNHKAFPFTLASS